MLGKIFTFLRRQLRADQGTASSWESKYYEMEYQRDLALGRIRTVNSLIKEDANWDFVKFCLENIDKSYSQICQDLIATYISEVSGSPNRFFVEFGAADGFDLSNTAFLDERGWSGILCEPSSSAFEKLKINRGRTKNVHACIFNVSGELVSFVETKNALLSTIEEFIDSDEHESSRIAVRRYLVPTLTLQDLLESCSAPQNLGLLSIDTEGTEYQILEKFQFGKYKFDMIFVEHNYGTHQIAISELISKNNYVQIFPKTSAHDHWFIREEIYKSIAHKLIN